MFKYKSYNTASAFYDVKYIHNSILQIFYDCCIITGTLFISILIYILFYILNHKHKNILPLIILYITLITHSLMDFDCSLCSITILLMLIIILSKVFSNNEKEIIKKNYILSYKFKYYFYKFSLIFILFIAIYLNLFESAMSLGKYFSSNNEYKKSNRFYTLATKISFELDGECYFNYAENLKILGDLDGSLNSLQKEYNIYPFNPTIKWNMSYIYEYLNVIKLRNELLDIEKYNKELYIIYEDFLNKKYEETKDNLYIDLLELLSKKYMEAKLSINKRAKYIKNQIDF